MWENAEKDLLDKWIIPETLNWPDRARNWFFGVGGTLDPETEKFVWMDKQLEIPVKKLR